MKIGTKSVLFGAHQFLIHPVFVFVAWWRLFGFPYDPRLWIAFFLHDIGYIGKPNMDGTEGEKHPYVGAKIMRLFGERWYCFCLFHSRFLAKKHNKKYSLLCVADKLAVAMEPCWLYLPRVILTGEINEYMRLAGKRKKDGEPSTKYESMNISTNTKKSWFLATKNYMRRWAYEHSDGKTDTWTPSSRKTINDFGTFE